MIIISINEQPNDDIFTLCLPLPLSKASSSQIKKYFKNQKIEDKIETTLKYSKSASSKNLKGYKKVDKNSVLKSFSKIFSVIDKAVIKDLKIKGFTSHAIKPILSLLVEVLPMLETLKFEYIKGKITEQVLDELAKFGYLRSLSLVNWSSLSAKILYKNYDFKCLQVLTVKESSAPDELIKQRFKKDMFVLRA